MTIVVSITTIPVIDSLLTELHLRFSNLSLSLMKSVQACSPKSSNFLDISLLQSFIDHYDLNSNELAIELIIQAKKILHKKDITTIAGAIQELVPLKVAFSELLKLLQIKCLSNFSC